MVDFKINYHYNNNNFCSKYLSKQKYFSYDTFNIKSFSFSNFQEIIHKILKNQNFIMIRLYLHFEFIMNFFSAYFIIFTSFSGEGGAKNPIPDSGESIMQVRFKNNKTYDKI